MAENEDLKIVYIPVDKLKPYERNARKHADIDVDAIAASIQAFGFRDPIGVWGKNNIIVEGHGRLMAAKKLGMDSVPCVRLDDMTDEQRRGYALAHNKTAELSSWDSEILKTEISSLNTAVDLSDFGFYVDFDEPILYEPKEEAGPVESNADDGKAFFDRVKNGDTSYDYDHETEKDTEYGQFVEKFKEKHTTDDCYTPNHIYGAVMRWACDEYDIPENYVVRPFYPGGDYEHYFYPKDCVVIDNPPFSILRQIVRFYQEKNVKFLLFAPALTLFNPIEGVCFLTVGYNIIYENGANVRTSFITNLEPEFRAKTAPDLYEMINQAEKKANEAEKEYITNQYPSNVITAAKMMRMSANGVELDIPASNSVFISDLDKMKEVGKNLFGGALLVSDSIAAESAAANEKADEAIRARASQLVEKYTFDLSDREKSIINDLERR